MKQWPRILYPLLRALCCTHSSTLPISITPDSYPAVANPPAPPEQPHKTLGTIGLSGVGTRIAAGDTTTIDNFGGLDRDNGAIRLGRGFGGSSDSAPRSDLSQLVVITRGTVSQVRLTSCQMV